MTSVYGSISNEEAPVCGVIPAATKQLSAWGGLNGFLPPSPDNAVMLERVTND